MLKYFSQVDDFLAFLGSEKGCSPHTMQAYAGDIGNFIGFLQSASVVEFSEVRREHFAKYLETLQTKGYASSSICRAIVAIKVLFRFLKREEYIKENRAELLSLPRLWQLIPAILSDAEIERLFAQPDVETEVGVRDLAILETLYGSGLRVSELCGLDIQSVGEVSVRVTGKGKKERIVPIGKKALFAIDQYLVLYRDCYPSEKQKALFLSTRGARMERVMVWRRVKHYGKLAGITKIISPHTLRHCFATHLLDHRAELRVIQEMLGHVSIRSTERYIHISQQHLKEAFESFHPRK